MRCGCSAWAPRCTGYALAPPTEPEPVRGGAGRRRACTRRSPTSATCRRCARRCTTARPEIVFHLAAQPLVRQSYREPVETYATNVMGTVHLLEAVRGMPGGARRRHRHHRQVLREPRVGLGLPRERADGRPRSLQQQQGLRRTGHARPTARRSSANAERTAWPWPRRAPATSSAAATGRADRLIPDILRAFEAGAAGPHPQPATPSAPGSTCWSRSSGYLRAGRAAVRATARPSPKAGTSARRRGCAAGALDRRAAARALGQARSWTIERTASARGQLPQARLLQGAAAWAGARAGTSSTRCAIVAWHRAHLAAQTCARRRWRRSRATLARSP